MAPRTKQQIRQIRLQSKAQIMEVALELFAVFGYRGTTVSQIAAKAGISKGLLYNYFSGKEELLHEIIRSSIAENIGWVQAIYNMDLPAFEKLERLVAQSIEMVKRDVRHWQLLTALAFQPDVVKGLEAEITAKQSAILPGMIAIFEELGIADPLMETWFFGAQLDGIFLHYMNLQEHYPLETMKDMLLSKYLTLNQQLNNEKTIKAPL